MFCAFSEFILFIYEGVYVPNFGHNRVQLESFESISMV